MRELERICFTKISFPMVVSKKSAKAKERKRFKEASSDQFYFLAAVNNLRLYPPQQR